MRDPLQRLDHVHLDQRHAACVDEVPRRLRHRDGYEEEGERAGEGAEGGLVVFSWENKAHGGCERAATESESEQEARYVREGMRL